MIGERQPLDVANELINKVHNLKISDRFEMVKESCPMSQLHGIGLFSAIAIPVETKQHYECPKEHLAVLQEFIPRGRRSSS